VFVYYLEEKRGEEKRREEKRREEKRREEKRRGGEEIEGVTLSPMLYDERPKS
jgi:hypothetical protein